MYPSFCIFKTLVYLYCLCCILLCITMINTPIPIGKWIFIDEYQKQQYKPKQQKQQYIPTQKQLFNRNLYIKSLQRPNIIYNNKIQKPIHLNYMDRKKYNYNLPFNTN
jgi:hypothetical protein